MSMEIKRDEPLSPEARQYLADRNEHDLIDLIDAAYPPPEPDGYDQMEPAELRAELSARGLATACKNVTLIARLREDDDAADAEAEAGTGTEEDAE